MVDLVAGELKLDRVAVRRKNFIQPSEFPFTQNFGLVVDSGDYDKSLDRALELAGYDELRKQQAEGRKQGRYIGIGLSTWIEICGFGPSAATAPATGGARLEESPPRAVPPPPPGTRWTAPPSYRPWPETTSAPWLAPTRGASSHPARV